MRGVVGLGEEVTGELKVEPAMEVLGPPKFGVLRMLKNSPRISKLTPSCRMNCLNMEASRSGWILWRILRTVLLDCEV